MKITQVFILFLLAHSLAFAEQEFYPSVIFQLDNKFNHHVLVVEKSTHKLYLYKNENQFPKLIKTYQIATGQIKGNKAIQGDKKTPEGIYQFQDFHSAKDLIDKYGKAGLIYGAGAFTLNYPNEIDRRANKTGGGIWLHSTDDDSRISKGLDSKGCVVVVDSDLKDISKYIDLKHTTMVIVENLTFLSKETWLSNKEALLSSVIDWANAWKEKDFNNYISQYSKHEFYDPRKGDFNQFKAYKRAIFSRSEVPQISFRYISIMKYNDYAVATFEQDYKSELIEDVGKKVLYLKRDKNYEWKIVTEQWHKLDVNQNLAFVPSMRFFNDPTEKTAEVKEN